MNKIISALALLSLTVPSVASASTAAGSLSVKSTSVSSASVKPVRAAAKSGKSKAVATPFLILAAIAVVAGVVVATGGSDSK